MKELHVEVIKDGHGEDERIGSGIPPVRHQGHGLVDDGIRDGFQVG